MVHMCQRGNQEDLSAVGLERRPLPDPAVGMGLMAHDLPEMKVAGGGSGGS